MKFLVAFALIAAVALADYTKPTIVSQEMAQIQEVITAIQSPSTDPATAAALEAMLEDLLGIKPEPVIIGPAIVDTDLSPIAVGPEIIDFPVPDGGVVTVPEAVVQPSPVVVGPAVNAEASPLVQVIVNVNAASSGPVPSPSPAIIPEIKPQPVIVVDEAQNFEPIDVEPVIVVDDTEVEPIQVAEPVIVEPVIIGTPIIPAPAVVLPLDLN